jgi:hypothetical protein
MASTTLDYCLPVARENHLEHVLVDAPGLVNDGQGEVQALQPLRHGR